MKDIDKMRPKEIYSQVSSQRELDGIRFFEKYRSSFVQVKCPACGNEGNPQFNKWGYIHNSCKVCNTLFVSPRPENELLELYYNQYEAPRLWTKLLLSADEERKKIQYAPRISHIISLLERKKFNRALDIGAGSGAFARCLVDSKDFETVVAMDISEECVASCKNQGIEAYCTSIENWDGDKFDIIFANDIVEHLFEPKEFIRACQRNLTDGGVLCIATPNGLGFDYKILRESTGNITPPEHLNYFNPASAELLLKESGFKHIIVETPGILDVDIIINMRNGGYDLKSKNEYLDYILSRGDRTVKSFQEFLRNNLLSSHMVVVAEK